MRIGDVNEKQRGSMGIPPDMMEAAAKAKEKTKKESIKAEDKIAEDEVSPEAIGFLKEDPKLDSPSLRDNVDMTESLKPTETLKKLGIDFTSEDLHSLLFKGVFEAKDVDIVKGYFKASIRTLRSGEYNEIEELMEEELESNPNMTRTHYEMLQSSFVISYAITELDGKSPTRVIMSKDKKPDMKATAKAKQKVLMALSTTLFNKLVRVHSVIKTCVDLISEDPELLKN